ncbi:hypothetical protein BY996DRAFT_6492072 [Phakopsora pachyrhizi]|nr:hypothetical protein BY996DRAFT_6492072 [Phakopsora pachyrhizi]
MSNKGRVLLNFLQHKFKVDMKTYIKECQRSMNQLGTVNINIPNDVLSYMILSKLHTRYSHHVDEIMINESMIKNPKQVLLKLGEIVHIEEARKSKNQAHELTSATTLLKPCQKNNKAKIKPEHPCSPGKHNELANHPQSKCWNLYPQLRPNYKGSKVNLSIATHVGNNMRNGSYEVGSMIKTAMNSVEIAMIFAR